MLKLHVCILFFYLTLASVLGARNINHAKSTTSKPILSLLDKFHQSDYKLSYEWAETVRVNKRFGDYRATIFKYNRTTIALNFTLYVNIDMGYDVELIVQLYKFSSNEYRVFPMRFEVNLCEAVSKDVFGSSKFAECGNLSCPLLKEKQYTIFNWTPEDSNLPPLVPTGKYMVEMQYLYHAHEMLLTRTYVAIIRLNTL